MSGLTQYGRIRVKKLLQPPESYDGWRVNQRSPQIGDVGTLLDILRADGAADRYVVESSGAGGVAAWLADFAADELEALE